MQCGYCTCGMIMAGVGAACARTPTRRRQEIVEYMDGNICRCGTYPRIIAAIRKAAQSDEGGQPMNDRTGHHDRSRLDRTLAIEPERYELREGPAYQFELDRRDFFKAMGGGILVLYLLDRDAEARGPAARRPSARRRRRRVGAPGHRRLAAHRRGRPDHRLHRQGRGRPEHPHVADPGGRRGAARADRRRSAWSWPTRS